MTKPQTDVIGPPPLSKCHQAPVKVISGNEGTSYWECTKCGQSCDLYQPPQTEPKNAPKDVSRLARRSTKVDKPTIAQTEQKRLGLILTELVNRNGPKLIPIKEQDIIGLGYAENEIESILTASNREARIDELEKLPTPKIDEVNMWARVTAHMARTKAGAWIQGARFMRNRVQSYKGKRIAELTKLRGRG